MYLSLKTGRNSSTSGKKRLILCYFISFSYPLISALSFSWWPNMNTFTTTSINTTPCILRVLSVPAQLQPKFEQEGRIHLMIETQGNAADVIILLKMLNDCFMFLSLEHVLCLISMITGTISRHRLWAWAVFYFPLAFVWSIIKHDSQSDERKHWNLSSPSERILFLSALNPFRFHKTDLNIVCVCKWTVLSGA